MKAKMWNYKTWVNTDVNNHDIMAVKAYLQIAGFTLLKEVDYRYKPQGYTCIVLLAESHLAIHTFPEQVKTYIELTSCNKKYLKRFKKMFKAFIIHYKRRKNKHGGNKKQ